MLYVNNLKDVNDIILQNRNSLIVLYFGASWCSPCRLLKKKLTDEYIMNKFDKLCVLYIDADKEELDNLFISYGVSNLPTQIFSIVNKKNEVIEVDRFTGFNWDKFIITYNKNYTKLPILEETNSYYSDSE